MSRKNTANVCRRHWDTHPHPRVGLPWYFFLTIVVEEEPVLHEILPYEDVMFSVQRQSMTRTPKSSTSSSNKSGGSTRARAQTQAWSAPSGSLDVVDVCDSSSILEWCYMPGGFALLLCCYSCLVPHVWSHMCALRCLPGLPDLPLIAYCFRSSFTFLSTSKITLFLHFVRSDCSFMSLAMVSRTACIYIYVFRLPTRTTLSLCSAFNCPARLYIFVVRVL